MNAKLFLYVESCSAHRNNMLKQDKSQRGDQAELVARTLDVLTCFSRTRPEWGITELATELSMTKSRVHRIARTLEAQGFFRQRHDSKRYQLGIRLIELGALAARQAGRSVMLRPILERLTQELGATLAVRLRDGDEIILVDSVENPAPVRVILSMGSRYPIYYGAAGMAISAALSDEELDACLPDGNLRQFAPNSFATAESFRHALHDVRETGYAVSDERVQPGVFSVGVAFGNSAGAVLGGMVAGFAKDSLDESRVPQIGKRMVETSYEVARLFEEFSLLGAGNPGRDTDARSAWDDALSGAGGMRGGRDRDRGRSRQDGAVRPSDDR